VLMNRFIINCIAEENDNLLKEQLKRTGHS